jgi:formate dehydrogenase major subunit
LLGNIGRPGGGVVALRGHANVQGATDLELLYHELPGYLPMPLRDAHPDLKTWLDKETPKGGFWVNRPKFMVSLLKAWFGDKATAENQYGYQWLPKRASADAYSHQHMFVDMYKGTIKGFLSDGQNPAVGGPNAKLARAALGKLEWLVVKDIFLTETAEFWKAPGAAAKDIKTEVFFLPAAPAAEKDGSLTNTMRLIQWHEKAVNPPGDVTSDAEFFVSLAKRLQKLYAGSKKERDQGFLATSFEYGDNPKEPNMELVLKEINGYATQDITDKDGKVVYKKNQALNTFAHMTDDGKTAGGCWIYTGVIVEGPDGKLLNKANGHKPADEKDPLGHGWGFAWPANRRILYNRAAADLAGKPWSERKKLIWWDPRPRPTPTRRASGRLDVPTSTPSWPGRARTGDKPFIMRRRPRSAGFGPSTTARSRALRPSSRRQNPLEAAEQPGGEDLERARPEERPGPGGLAGLPLRGHHVPPHRASPLWGHVALPAHARRAVPLALRGDQPRAGRGARDQERGADHGQHPAGQGPRDRHGHEPAQAVHDRRQEDSPDRHPVALGLQRHLQG